MPFIRMVWKEVDAHGDYMYLDNEDGSIEYVTTAELQEMILDAMALLQEVQPLLLTSTLGFPISIN